jgi:hypothetical protein
VPKRAAPTLTKNVVEAGVWRRRPYRRRVVLPSETPKVFVNDLTRFELCGARLTRESGRDCTSGR